MIEYDRWQYVTTDSAEQARKFFGVPGDWPCEFDGFDKRKPGRRWRVLSRAWVRQQNDIRTAVAEVEVLTKIRDDLRNEVRAMMRENVVKGGKGVNSDATS